jgi:hypothetical protein
MLIIPIVLFIFQILDIQYYHLIHLIMIFKEITIILFNKIVWSKINEEFPIIINHFQFIHVHLICSQCFPNLN